MKSGQFSLPGKQELQASETLIEVIMFDMAEQPNWNARKKAKTLLQRQKEASHPKTTGDREHKNSSNPCDSLCKGQHA